MKSEIQFESWLSEIIYQGNEVMYEGEEIKIKTFEEESLLTYNRGLVIRLQDGEEFQLTIVKR